MNDLETLLANQKKVELNPDNISEKVVEKVYQLCNAKNLVTFLPVTTPAPWTRKLKAIYTTSDEHQRSLDNFCNESGIDAPTYLSSNDTRDELISVIAQEVAMEMDRFIVTNISERAKKVTSYMGLSKPSFNPDWVITSPETIQMTFRDVQMTFRDGRIHNGEKQLGSVTQYRNPNPSALSMYCCGKVGNMDVYSDPLFPKKRALFGMKDAYTYIPYIIFDPRTSDNKHFEFYSHDLGAFSRGEWFEEVYIEGV